MMTVERRNYFELLSSLKMIVAAVVDSYIAVGFVVLTSGPYFVVALMVLEEGHLISVRFEYSIQVDSFLVVWVINIYILVH